MKKFRTHYQNLKVDRNAPSSVIRAAYKALSLDHHPDRARGDSDAERRFRIIRESYEVLIDPEQRKKHDEWIQRQEQTSKSNSHTRSDTNTRTEESRRTNKKSSQYTYTPPRTEVKSRYIAPYLFVIFIASAAFGFWYADREGYIDDVLNRFLTKREIESSSSEISEVSQTEEGTLTSSQPRVSSAQIEEDPAPAEVVPEVEDQPEVIESSAVVQSTDDGENQADSGPAGQAFNGSYESQVAFDPEYSEEVLAELRAIMTMRDDGFLTEEEYQRAIELIMSAQ